MHTKQYSKQLEKRKRIGNQTLVIGMDIGSEFNAACFMDKEGNVYEHDYEPSIEILQDPEQEASAGLFVKGGIPTESADGYIYEVRNRAALCRCGKSRNKPFCDATHISIRFSDEKGTKH